MTFQFRSKSGALLDTALRWFLLFCSARAFIENAALVPVARLIVSQHLTRTPSTLIRCDHGRSAK